MSGGTRRLLSIIMSVTLALTMVPLPAFAAGAQGCGADAGSTEGGVAVVGPTDPAEGSGDGSEENGTADVFAPSSDAAGDSTESDDDEASRDDDALDGPALEPSVGSDGEIAPALTELPEGAETAFVAEASGRQAVILSAQPSDDERTILIEGTGAGFAGAVGVKFAVWSAVGGQDDLVWYDATRTDGGWTKTVLSSSHRSFGLYHVHAYQYANGPEMIGTCTFSLTAPVASLRMEQSADERNRGMFTVTIDIDEASCPSGVESVQVPTWSVAGGQDDIVWYQASAPKATGDPWTVSIPCAAPDRDPGAYASHAYVRAGNGILGFAGESAGQMEAGSAQLVVEKTADEREVLIRAYGGSFATAASVQFPTWSAVGGQDDIVWYAASKGTDNVWSRRVTVSDHHSAGTYWVHAYANVRGRLSCVAMGSFDIAAPEVHAAFSQTDDQKARGVFQLSVTDVSCPSGVAFMQAPTWSAAGGQDDIVWYSVPAPAVPDAPWTLEIPCLSDIRDPGTYISHVYIGATNGAYGFAGAVSGEAECAGDSLRTTTSDGERTFLIEAYGPGYAKAASVQFPVWSAKGGQDDIIWYTAHRQGGGWAASVPISAHGDAGDYAVHAYGRFGASLRFLDACGFAVSSTTADIAFSQSADQLARGVFQVSVSNVSCPSGVSLVQVPTWSAAGGQDDIIWYTARADASSPGVWSVEVPCASPVRDPGAYIAHAYVTAANRVFGFVGAATGEAQIGPATLRASVNATETSVVIEAFGGDFAKASRLQLPCWSARGGQDDIRWYDAVRSGAGWTYTVPISNHATAGAYAVHAYGDVRGSFGMLGACSFDISAPTAQVRLDAVGNGAYDVVVESIVSPSGAKAVSIPSWTKASGQDDIVWHSAQAAGEGAWSARIEAGAHGCEEGTYLSHAYVTAGNGILAFVGDLATEVACSDYLYVQGALGSGQRFIYLKNPTRSGAVQMPCWTATNGQDDIVWYTATAVGANLYRADVKCSNFKHTGTVFCHAYVGGGMVGATSFTVDSNDIIPAWVAAKAKLRLTEDYRSSFDHGSKPASCQKYIVLHDTEGDGDAAGVINWWDSNGQGVAAHFIVNKDGSIVQCVGMDRITHHAGFGNTGNNARYGVTDESRDDKRGTVSIGSWARDYGMNSYSIGIEMVHVGGRGYYPEAQLNALDDLIAYIDAYYGFESNIIDHKAWRSGNSDTSPEFAGYLRNYQTIRRHR